MSRPVDDAFAVQEHESRGDLRRVETRSWLLKLPGLLDVEHQIATVHKFHHEEQTVLKNRKQGDQTEIYTHGHKTTHGSSHVIKRPMNVGELRLLQG